MRISDWSSDVCSSDLIEATINNDHFDYLVDAYKEKYGSPVKNKIESVQNKAGAHFENQILTWKSASSTLEIEQRYENVTLMREIGRASCRERVCQYV